MLEAAIDRLGASTADRWGIELEDALELVVQSSHELFKVAGSGVMIFDDLDVLRYVAASDRRARVLEKLQEQTAEGPCVDAAVYATIVESADVLSDTRWPELSIRLTGQGVSGVLGVPLRINGATVGSLNVYTETPTCGTPANERPFGPSRVSSNNFSKPQSPRTSGARSSTNCSTRLLTGSS